MKNTLFLITILISVSSFAQKVGGLPDNFDDLVNSINSPNDIDKATSNLKMDAKLFNPYLATYGSMKNYGIDLDAIHIPVQISKRDGGRESIYFLDAGEKVLTGIFISGEDLYFRHITRLTGKAQPAVDGDTYLQEISSKDGKVLFSGEYILDVINIKKGFGKMKPKDGEENKTDIWVLWSCIKITEDAIQQVQEVVGVEK